MLSMFTNWRLNRLYSELTKLDLAARPRREWVDEHGILRFAVDPVETQDIAHVIVHGGLSEKTRRNMLRLNERELWLLVWERKRKRVSKAIAQ